jgi:pimeloyl-ACP methyl ester carboxylesterase
MKCSTRALVIALAVISQACTQQLRPNDSLSIQPDTNALHTHKPQTNEAQTSEQAGAHSDAASKSLFASECVILLHGLARTHKSMIPLATQLQARGYKVVNVDYASRNFPIAELAQKAIPPALAQCRAEPSSRIHFVTHSLGGILVRQYLSQQPIPELARVVMLAPPNKGSEVVDWLKHAPGFGLINGPAGKELGTDKNSLPNTLGKVDFELGVIAGTRSINLLLSLYLPNPDDGKVSLESTKIEGMQDFISLAVSHPYIMKDDKAIAQIIYFLVHGKFLHTAEQVKP